jgi:hypothetical protein
VAALAALAVSGCTTVRTTSPLRSAQEELLISTAADRAATALAAQMPAGIRAYLDTSDFGAQDGQYAIAAIQDAFLRRGLLMAADRSQADTVVIVRTGGLATDERSTLIGTPAFVPPILPTVTIPEIALYKDAVNKGVAKFAATAYDPKTGRLIVSTDPAYGFSWSSSGTILFLFSWEKTDTGVHTDEQPVVVTKPVPEK